MKTAKGILFAFLIVLLTASSCNSMKPTPTEEKSVFDLAIPSPINANESKALLLSRGYGYVYGDVILLDTKNSPQVGDVILYNWTINKSDFHYFGPTYHLVKVIALPGDSVTFEKWSYKANGYEVILQEHNTPETTSVIWGSTIYEDVSGLTLQLPQEEYLGDKWIGKEGLQEYYGETYYSGHNRFTIKKEAISGIVIRTIEHKNIAPITW